MIISDSDTWTWPIFRKPKSVAVVSSQKQTTFKRNTAIWLTIINSASKQTFLAKNDEVVHMFCRTSGKTHKGGRDPASPKFGAADAP